jgi:hypothetical protein
MYTALRLVLLTTAILPTRCLALLEEPIVSFEASASGLGITSAPILCAPDDFIGVHIAANNLAKDLEQITGAKRDVKQVVAANISTAVSAGTVIIAGSTNSSLIQSLSTSKTIDISDIQGKWESFKTTVVKNPFPGVESALVIAGSDKRGTIFGIYTLAEQSGQSPYNFL